MSLRCMWTFASGNNNAGEVIGYMRSGIPPGITIWRLDRPKGAAPRWSLACAMEGRRPDWRTRVSSVCLWAAGQVLRAGVPLFVDSGAYAEAAEDAPPLTDDQIDLVLYVTEALSLVDGVDPGLLWSVFPDQVGSQRGSLRRLRRWKEVMKRLLGRGVKGIVVLHKGGRSLPAYAEAAAETLETTDVILGFPVVGRRTTPEEITATIRRLSWTPAGVHLLGISPDSRHWNEYAEAIGELPESIEVASDAVMHRTQRLLRRAGTVGALTRELDEARRLIREHFESSDETFSDPILRPDFYLRSEIMRPSQWLSMGERRRIWREAQARGYAMPLLEEAWRVDPSMALRTWLGPHFENVRARRWVLGQLLDAHTATFDAHTTPLRKEQALRRHFGGHAPDRLLRPEEVLPVRPFCFTPPRRAQMQLFDLG